MGHGDEKKVCPQPTARIETQHLRSIRLPDVVSVSLRPKEQSPMDAILKEKERLVCIGRSGAFALWTSWLMI